jgi:prepilin-type N-terminal cleavage/methylation domain-containing protein
MKKLMSKSRGFTIIEVIIVLVISAVIMIAVFVVVPQLQRSARNNQRRNDIQRVLVAARQYYSTSSFPGGTSAAQDIKNLISSDFKDPSLSSNSTTSRDYVIKLRTTTRTGVVTWIEIFYDKKCIASQSTATGNGNLEDSTGSIAVTLDVEPIKPTMANGFYYGASHYCVND